MAVDIKKIVGYKDIKSGNFWISLLAEFLGTLFLVLVGCGSTTGGSVLAVDFTEIAFCFGLMVAIMVQTIGAISGGHINPAVTAGMMATGECSIIRGIFYIIVQCVGAIFGALILAGLLPKELRSTLGQTNLHPDVSAVQGMGIEIMITFVLVFTVFSVVDPNRQPNLAAPLMIGLSVVACHLWAIKYTGSSMNTARSFGPAVVGNNWENHWIYWVGPLIGGMLAGLSYKLMFVVENKRKVENVEAAEMIEE